MKKTVTFLALLAVLLSACAPRAIRPTAEPTSEPVRTEPTAAGETSQTEAVSIQTEPAASLVREERMVPGTEPLEESESGTSSAASEGELAETIPFQVFYRGFTPIPLPAEDPETYTKFSEAGMRIIQSDDAWHSFMGEYCPGIPYYMDVDFAKECMIASVIGFARPTYNSMTELLSLKAENGRLVFEYSEETDDRIYALNINVSNFYVEVLVVNREDLPDGLL